MNSADTGDHSLLTCCNIRMTFHPNSPHGPGPHGLADRLTARDTVDMKCHRSTTSTIGAIFAAASCQEHRMSMQCHKPIKVLPFPILVTTKPVSLLPLAKELAKHSHVKLPFPGNEGSHIGMGSADADASLPILGAAIVHTWQNKTM